MGKLLSEEITESKKPLFLIYTSDKDFQNLLYSEFSEKLSLLFVSDCSPEDDSEETYHIKKSDQNLLPHLEETINYAVVIFSEQKDKEGIEHLLTKLRKDSTKTAFLIPAANYKEYIDVLLEVKADTNIIPALYGDILENSSSEGQFLKIIRMALSKEKIKLKGNDLSPVFPISKRDFITCIKQLLFSNMSHALYYLFYKKPQTLLSAIHFLARLEPELEFEMDHEHPMERFEERSTMDQNLSDKLNLRIYYLDKHLKGFSHAVEHLEASPEKTYMQPLENGERRFSFPKIHIVKFTPSVSLALFSALALFLTLNLISGVLGIIFLKSSIHAFEKNDFGKAKEKGMIAKTILSIPIPTLAVTQSAISYLPFMKYAYDTLNLITKTSELTTVASSLIQKSGEMGKGISKKDFEKILLDSQYLYHSGSRILLSQNNRTVSNLLKPQTAKALSLITIMPSLLGYDSEKEYLILFMNNAELRPTGGFIGSVGRLIMKNGKIKEFVIQDVYDLDGQLTRHFEPHYIVRRNLQPHLYLRDSNFDLDFQRSASLSAMIYNLESGNTPDGVVAVDFNFIKKILEITGPIELKDYNKIVNADNSLDFLQETIEDKFFPGSTQKKDVLNALFKSITLSFENHPEYLVSIALALPELLEEKHILLSYQNNNIQSLLSALNFGGEIKIQDESNKDIIYDILGFNEANIGVNKVNKDISRSIFYQADLTSRLSKAKISFRNESEKNDYKTYLRLIAPKNSTLIKIRIDGEEVETIDAVTDPRIYEAANFSPDRNVLEVDRENDYSKTIFGTVVEVKKNTIMSIEFEYTNPTLFLENTKDSYRLSAIKQPGTNSTPVVFNVLFSKDFSAKGEGIGSFGDGNIKIENDLRTDLNYKISFTKE